MNDKDLEIEYLKKIELVKKYNKIIMIKINQSFQIKY